MLRKAARRAGGMSAKAARVEASPVAPPVLVTPCAVRMLVSAGTGTTVLSECHDSLHFRLSVCRSISPVSPPSLVTLDASGISKAALSLRSSALRSSIGPNRIRLRARGLVARQDRRMLFEHCAQQGEILRPRGVGHIKPGHFDAEMRRQRLGLKPGHFVGPSIRAGLTPAKVKTRVLPMRFKPGNIPCRQAASAPTAVDRR
jgi:hypothetical protein